MDYGFWYDVAKYANDNWKGCFTEREIAEGAYEYKIEWDTTVENRKVTHTISELLARLGEDGTKEASDFEETIQEELDYLNIGRCAYV